MPFLSRTADQVEATLDTDTQCDRHDHEISEIKLEAKNSHQPRGPEHPANYRKHREELQATKQSVSERKIVIVEHCSGQASVALDDRLCAYSLYRWEYMFSVVVSVQV